MSGILYILLLGIFCLIAYWFIGRSEDDKDASKGMLGIGGSPENDDTSARKNAITAKDRIRQKLSARK